MQLLLTKGTGMLMRLYHTRYTEQIDAATILAVGMTSDRASSRLRVLIDLA